MHAVIKGYDALQRMLYYHPSASYGLCTCGHLLGCNLHLKILMIIIEKIQISGSRLFSSQLTVQYRQSSLCKAGRITLT
jgi:hypothetical protein